MQSDSHVYASLKSFLTFSFCVWVVMKTFSVFLISSLSFLSLHPPGLVSHSDLDDRAIEALKEFNEEGALQVLLQFKDSDLSHVQVWVWHCWCIV